MNEPEKINIETDYIPLGQFIKLLNILDSGGMIKAFLQDQGVLVNGEPEHRRGRKLYPDDVVEMEGIGVYIVTKD
ncbi:S4 domain-containing protein YaaA [Lentibacillus sp. CBA3610]|uniref:S4 domain-containing protein YaaA n=1 Tax=Lentibacillus sp. CBA3610 TaxID=2518176 RepID=UPI0015953136|nr:S4 domain-containing protein YaaA [Lentibacillus sp. CBA3610]QKY70840.1 S4 domain-containing protein YaaA [Lentibacillus sp. CBA3610]